jgi:hypothetical protein
LNKARITPNTYLEPAQAIIDSLPERNAARERAREYFSDWRRTAARTGVGVAEAVGGAVVGKTLGVPEPWEEDQPAR